MRTQKEDRLLHGARWDEFAEVFHQIDGTLVANGDLFSKKDVDKFMELFPEKKPAVMIARGAVRTPAVVQELCGL